MNPKSFEILKSFTKEDLKSFKNFVISPFFKVSSNTSKLYELLMDYYPEFNSKSLTEENLFSKIYPEKIYNSSTLRNLFSELADALENYLTQLGLQCRTLDAYDLLRVELMKRKLAKPLAQNIQKTYDILSKEGEFENTNLIDSFRMLTDNLNHLTLNKSRNNTSFFEESSNLHSERGRMVTYLFVKEIIKGYCSLLTFDNTFKVNKEKNFIFKLFDRFDFDQLLSFLSQDSDNNYGSAMFELYHAFMTAFSRSENDLHYYNYKKLFEKNSVTIGTDEVRFHTVNLIRYCRLKCADPETAKKFEKELFDVYNMIIEKQYYKSQLAEHLPVELFRTIVIHGLKLRKFKWTIEFINGHKKKLSPDKRENMYHFSCAVYFFHIQKYKDSMNHFHKVQLNHFMLKIDLKNLMLKTYYELNDYESALSLIDSYKHFLANDITLSNIEKKKNKNFICAVQKMIEYQTSFSPMIRFDIEKFMKSNIADMEWIEEKMMILEKSYNKSA